MKTNSDPPRHDQLERFQHEWWEALERSEATVVVKPTLYRDGDHIADHRHSRSQLLYALTGSVTVTTASGRWLLPAEHALWIPAGTVHAVDIAGDVDMRSVYVKPDALDRLPTHLHVAALTPLMRNLIGAAGENPAGSEPDDRALSLMQCLMHEIPQLHELPLGLPFPSNPKAADLCRIFLKAPSSRTDIDRWAETIGMSRRSFTRHFRRETGLSLSTWRQKACLLAALPRLSAGEAVTSVALDLGYDSVPAFTTMFKRMLGAPPKAYFRATAS